MRPRGLKIADLRHRITIQKLILEESPNGPVKEWIDRTERWGKIELMGLNGREKYGQIGHSEVTHRIIFRGMPDISYKDTRFKHQGKIYQPIEPPANADGLGKWTTIAVKEVQAYSK